MDIPHNLMAQSFIWLWYTCSQNNIYKHFGTFCLQFCLICTFTTCLCHSSVLSFCAISIDHTLLLKYTQPPFNCFFVCNKRYNYLWLLKISSTMKWNTISIKKLPELWGAIWKITSSRQIKKSFTATVYYI